MRACVIVLFPPLMSSFSVAFSPAHLFFNRWVADPRVRLQPQGAPDVEGGTQAPAGPDTPP